MKQDTKQLWISALRSDEYKQGKQRLAKFGQGKTTGVVRHCCLGVLCEVLPYVERIQTGAQIVYVTTRTEEESTTVLPYTVAEREEFDRVSPWIDYPGKDEFGNSMTFRISLVELNDSGFTFNQIADMIERFL